MAKFYGTIQGNRGMATRAGSRNITTSAQSYDGSVITNLYYDFEGTLSVRIDIEDESTSYGKHTYFNGSVEDLKHALKMYQEYLNALDSEAEYYEQHREEFDRLENSGC